MMTGGEGADTFVYTDVGDEPIEISDYDRSVDTFAIQFPEDASGSYSMRKNLSVVQTIVNSKQSFRTGRVFCWWPVWWPDNSRG